MMMRQLCRQLAIAGMMAVPMVAVSAAASAEDLYGSIAWSRSTQDKGYAWNYSNRAEAERRAVDECNSVSGSSDCTALVWFRNACGSIAESRDNSAGTGWGSTRALAERYALESCSGVGQGCTITRTVCTGD
jgi:serine/threonine-protein kinase